MLRSLDPGLVSRCNGSMKRALLALIACIIALAGVAPEAMAAGAKRGLWSSSAIRSSGECCSAAATARSISSRATRATRRAATAIAPRRGRPSTRRAGHAPAAASIPTGSERSSAAAARRQVTYKGHALYFYVHDPKGQVLCNDVFEFGGTWFALDSKGRPPS